MRSDEELMVAHTAGDRDAFAELFRRYAPPLERVLQAQFLARSEVEDLIQQTFLQVHRARHDFDPLQSFRPWLFTIAFNLKRELYRKRKRRPEAVLDENAPELATASVHHARSENLNALDRGLSKLPPDQHEVITLHWFGGLSFPEVARAVGATTAAVKVRAHRGYVSLRRVLEDLPGGDANARSAAGSVPTNSQSAGGRRGVR
ncbi:MAG TPA: RNA polymerase sigma factor [Polyangiaceae bacterium]|nr:RNA polymerase sigma factor [Polyangiaceae bacterium]